MSSPVSQKKPTLEEESMANAITKGDIETVRKLLKVGFNLNVLRFHGSYIDMAAEHVKGDKGLEMMELLLDHGGDVNAKGADEATPLHYAASSNSPEMVEFLIKKGADVNTQDDMGITPLMDANKKNAIEIFKLLMANGADINIEDNMGNTIASFVSKEYAKYGKERLKMILDYGADPFFDDRCPNEECRNLLAEYRWKRLKERDKDTARRYSKNFVFGENSNLNLPKEIWEIILLHKRQQMLCQNLNSNKNREILYLFALELGIVIPNKESVSKAKLCALISRQLTYGRDLSRQDKVEKDLVRHRNVIKNLAFLYGIDPNKSLPEILSQLSGVL